MKMFLGARWGQRTSIIEYWPYGDQTLSQSLYVRTLNTTFSNQFSEELTPFQDPNPRSGLHLKFLKFLRVAPPAPI